MSVRLVSVWLALVLSCAPNVYNGAWYRQHVVWQYGSEGRAWETSFESPDGKEHYRLALEPLWAVEGGVIGMEIILANQAHPDDSLLGERDGHPQPFVITVGELQSGIKHSQFGATRVFVVAQETLQVTIQGARLGNGVGSGSTYCKNCKNIRELTVDFSLETK